MPPPLLLLRLLISAAARQAQVLCVSHPRRAEELVGDKRIEGRVDVRLVNHPDTALQIKDIRSSCIGGWSSSAHAP